MSPSPQRVKELAAHAKAVATLVKRAHVLSKNLLATNMHLSIDWGAGQKPEYIEEDANGNVADFQFSRQQVSNLIGSLDQFVKLMENQAVSQGDHLGNINQVADVYPA